MLRSVSTPLLLTALLGLTPAFAVDGQILINQASVMAAGGFPFGIGQAGSYKLSGNLTVPADANGIVIRTSGVTLDLNGFTIGGAIACAGQVCTPHTSNSTGITYVADETVIRNGHINGFDNGIIGEIGSGTIEDIHVTNTAAFAINTTNSTVRRSQIVRNAGLGLACGGCAVIDNLVLLNAKGGVNLGGGTFSGNVVGSNSGTNAFFGTTVISAHNNNCNDAGC